MVLNDLLLATIWMNIMNVTEHLFNPLALWENEKKERDTEDRSTTAALLPFSLFSHAKAVSVP